MIAIDTNILVAAHREEIDYHEKSKECVSSLLNGFKSWAIPWACLHELYAVITNKKIFKNPTTPEEACFYIRFLMRSDYVEILSEQTSHWDTLEPFLNSSQIRAGMIHDAKIAAICLYHGVTELWTLDRDFSRFPKLITKNPLV